MPFTDRPPGWQRTRRRILARDRGVCWICRKPGADTLDHLVPRSQGGGHGDANLRAAHRSCNSQRQDKDVAGTPAITPRPSIVLPRARRSRWR
jgi:5-methylcytosine-specific restriction endonuclease McrA